jgi:hypothetical protein
MYIPVPVAFSMMILFAIFIVAICILTNYERDDYSANLDMRLRAIVSCLYFGIMPWQLYESSCHYKGTGYWRHLCLNLVQSCIWLAGYEEKDDIDFEAEVNPSWGKLFSNLTRWQRATNLNTVSPA